MAGTGHLGERLGRLPETGDTMPEYGGDLAGYAAIFARMNPNRRIVARSEVVALSEDVSVKTTRRILRPASARSAFTTPLAAASLITWGASSAANGETLNSSLCLWRASVSSWFKGFDHRAS